MRDMHENTHICGHTAEKDTKDGVNKQVEPGLTFLNLLFDMQTADGR